MSLFAVISSAVGGGLGLLQGTFEKKQETRRFEIEKQLENERYKVESNASVEIAKTGIDIEKYKSIVALHEASKAKYEQEKQEYSDFSSAVVDLTKVDITGNTLWDKIPRFLSALVRPNTTYYFLILSGLLVFFNPHSEVIQELVFTELSYILAFWFVRRSYDKNQISNIFQKKKA